MFVVAPFLLFCVGHYQRTDGNATLSGSKIKARSDAGRISRTLKVIMLTTVTFLRTEKNVSCSIMKQLSFDLHQQPKLNDETSIIL